MTDLNFVRCGSPESNKPAKQDVWLSGDVSTRGKLDWDDCMLPSAAQVDEVGDTGRNGERDGGVDACTIARSVRDGPGVVHEQEDNAGDDAGDVGGDGVGAAVNHGECGGAAGLATTGDAEADAFDACDLPTLKLSHRLVRGRAGSCRTTFRTDRVKAWSSWCLPWRSAALARLVQIAKWSRRRKCIGQ
ncbi:hypothetical protein ON010_g6914 [Phytophthora cinnamomi]|nr:hypothetical protein ON010_g6914 [Phytophthora cinnamomi]